MLKRLVASFTLIVATNVYAEPVNNTQTEIVHHAVSSFMLANNVKGVAVELFVEGKPYAYYFGEANSETKKPVTGKTIFELGSITKLMTSLLLAQEVDSAKVQLGDSIVKYLPQLPPEYEDITLLNLATHTSGLPFKLSPDVNTVTKLQAYLQTTLPTDSADENWKYSNVGIGLLGIIIEKTEHKDLNTLLRKKILLPLHMQPIGFTVGAQDKNFYAQGYGKDGNPVKPDVSGVFSGASAMKASAEDMRRFLGAAIGLPGTPESILYPIRMTQAPYFVTTDFMQGLGWQVHSFDEESVLDLLQAEDSDLHKPARTITSIEDKPVFDGDNLLDKTGGTEGFRAYIALIPNKQTGIVILANKFVSGKSIVMTGRDILFKLNHIEPESEEIN